MLRWTAAAMWFTLCACSLFIFALNKGRPGTVGSVSVSEPTTSIATPYPLHGGATKASIRYRIILYLHPMCPCSMATIRNLERATRAHLETISVTIVFADSGDPAWRMAANAKRVEKFDKWNIVWQPMHRLLEGGVSTSGHCMVTDNSGKLLFSGGITPARGHVGDCRGYQFIDRLCGDYPIPSLVETPIFGCSFAGITTRPAVTERPSGAER